MSKQNIELFLEQLKKSHQSIQEIVFSNFLEPWYHRGDATGINAYDFECSKSRTEG